MSVFAYLFGRSNAPPRSRVQPRLEVLEDRVVPAVFLVNTTDDTPDANLNDPEAKDLAGKTSLRAAIMQANHTVGLDTIKFDVANGEVTIKLQTAALPPITDQVVIDAVTLPQNRPQQVIRLSRDTGINKLEADNIAGLTFQAGPGGQPGAAGSQVLGLTIFGFDQPGNAGIILENVASVRISNVKLHDNVRGLVIAGPNAHDNLIIGSRIGQMAGNQDGNFNDQEHGVFIHAGAHTNRIGLTGEVANTISGNSKTGVTIRNANNNIVFNNIIGLAADGAGVNPVEQGIGVAIETVALTTAFPTGNVIGGKAIRQGGKIQTAANVISGNKLEGVFVGINGAGAGNRVEGNFIGTDKGGTLARGNGRAGVVINANGTTVGGPQIDDGNVIVNNGHDGTATRAARSGVFVFSNQNTIGFNSIGRSNDGLANHGNGGHGIFFSDVSGAQGTLVYLNAILNNAGDGVRDPNSKNKWDKDQRNSIGNNGGLGINIGPDGVTTDGMPVILSATVNGQFTTVTGTLTSTPNTTFQLAFFGNDNPDPSGYGEGEVFLGFVTVTTDSTGFASFSVDLESVYSQFVTAVATDIDHADGGTSEFALNRVVGYSAAVGARIWADTDADGIQDEGEAGIEGIIITLVSLTGGTNYAAVTDADGRFLFTDVDPGQYRMVVILPVGYSFTQQNQGGNDEIDSDVDQTGQTDPFTLAPGEFNPFLAAGLLSSIVIDDDPLPGDG